MNYKGYTYKELLQDDFFQESQLTPTDESIRFWDTIIKNDRDIMLLKSTGHRKLFAEYLSEKKKFQQMRRMNY